MPPMDDLLSLITEPREDLGVEYKGWLDLTTNEHRAVLAKAAMALANHGGGHVVLGMAEVGGTPASVPRPDGVPEPTQDAVNAAVRRYASPEFHCQAYTVPHPATGVMHLVVAVPGGLTEPVMSRRDCPGVLLQNKCYMRKPGPRSEEASTPEEWRALLGRCLRAGREDMLDAIRAIVTGQVEPSPASPDAGTLLAAFCRQARERWATLVADLPPDEPARFPRGSFELGFRLVGAEPAPSLADLRERLALARRTRCTGWPLFLEMSSHGREPHIVDGAIEAWVGRRTGGGWRDDDPSLRDFWRASRDGELFSVRGFKEDALQGYAPGSAFDVTLPVWRAGEGLLFAERLSGLFAGVSAIAVRCSFTGLENRTLVSVGRMRAVFGDDVSRSGSIVLTGQPSPGQVRDNLVEVVHQLLSPLYELFDFFRLTPELVGEELAKMRRGGS